MAFDLNRKRVPLLRVARTRPDIILPQGTKAGDRRNKAIKHQTSQKWRLLHPSRAA